MLQTVLIKVKYQAVHALWNMIQFVDVITKRIQIHVWQEMPELLNGQKENVNNPLSIIIYLFNYNFNQEAFILDSRSVSIIAPNPGTSGTFTTPFLS